MVALSGDITAAEAPATIAEALKAEFGRLDILVNNAGVLVDKTYRGSNAWGCKAMMAAAVKSETQLEDLLAVCNLICPGRMKPMCQCVSCTHFPGCAATAAFMLKCK